VPPVQLVVPLVPRELDLYPLENRLKKLM
jgi:hypothetical protein